MKNYSTKNGAVIEDYSESPKDFINKLKNKYNNLSNEYKLCIQPNGLVILANLENKSIALLGCPMCFDVELEQNENGDPTINGKRLVSVAEIKDPPKHLSSFIIANLWLCPNCFTPNTSLFPEIL